MSLPEHAQYKFLLHLDGTAASNRLLKLLFMGSVVLKQVAHMPGEEGRAKCAKPQLQSEDSVYEEFFYKDLKPWVLASWARRLSLEHHCGLPGPGPLRAHLARSMLHKKPNRFLALAPRMRISSMAVW